MLLTNIFCFFTGVNNTCDSMGHLHVVRDVFEAFLATDNVLVFANAALDCVLCLLKHVKGSGNISVKFKSICLTVLDIEERNITYDGVFMFFIVFKSCSDMY